MGDGGDVSGQDPSLNCRSECAAEGERFHLGVGGAELCVIEAFEVGDLESSDRDAAKSREDVAFYLASVAMPGRLGQCVGFAG